MAEQELTPNRSKRKKTEPKYKSINDVPVSDIINARPEQSTPQSVIAPEEAMGQMKMPVKPAVPNNTINISDIASILATNSSSAYYKIEFPSLGKEYTFKQLTLGQQRTISKHSADYENRAEQMRIRLGMLKSICLDADFDPFKITWAEFINALLIVRNSNFLDDLKYNIKCNSKDCDVTFPFTVDLIELSEKLNNIVKRIHAKQDKFFEFEINGRVVRFDLDFPLMTDYIVLAERYSDSDEEDVDVAAFIYPYIREIYIDGVRVDTTEIKKDIKKFQDFIDETFIGMSFKQFAIRVGEIFDEFSSSISSYEITCPVCKNTRTLSLDIDDFFEL